MTFELEWDVFCHSLINPPAHNKACDVNLRFISPDNLITLTKKEVSLAETKYSIRIPDAIAIGFTFSEQHILPNEFANLILAFNLLLKRVCITYKRSEFSTYNVVRTSPGITDHVRITVGFSEELDPQPVVQLFRKVQQIRRSVFHTSSSSLYDLNLYNALRNYEMGMSEFNMLFKFKHIHNALELATNVDGTSRERGEFDSKVNNLSGVSAKTVRTWREFYNRTKHIQRNPEDIKTYTSGNQKLSKNLSSIRGCTQTVLLSRLDP